MAESKSKSRAQEAADIEEIRNLLREIQKENQLIRRYFYSVAVALAILLLVQFFPPLIKLIQAVVIAVVVAVVLFTAPVWSKFVEQVSDRIPWTSRWYTKKPKEETE